MKLKKLASIGLAAVMIASLAACGGAGSGETAGSTEAAGKEAAVSTEAAADSTETAADADVAAQEDIKPEDISVLYDDSHIYGKMTLGNYDSITTYTVKGYEDVPFLMASDYINFLYEGKEKIDIEDGKMRITVNGVDAYIDPVEDTIHFDDLGKFTNDSNVPGGVLYPQEFNVVTPSTKNKSTATKGKPVDISLKDYNLPVIAYEDSILMPFLGLQNTFGAVSSANVLAYNGQDYFDAFSSNMFITNNGDASLYDSPYMKALYNGPFSKKTETTKAYAEYGYNSTCLLLDLIFGHKKEKNITTFDEYFTRINAKKAMSSTNPKEAAAAEMLLFDYLFDSGHDAMVSQKTVFGDIDQKEVEGIVDDIKESDDGKDLFGNGEDVKDDDGIMDAVIGALLEKGFNIPENVPLMAWSLYFGSAKDKDYGHERIDYADDTAVIYFDSFKSDSERSPSYYLNPITEEDEALSNYAFFYDCFKDIKKHDEVKNVVINICDNGGGEASALITILGFLSKDGEVRFTTRDMITGAYNDEYYHVDTNLDGVADDKDGHGGEYDYYIMCSGASYSCGNALPYFAQKEGLAKIIGTKPGGGDCVVGSFVDAYGYISACSSFKKLGTMEGKKFVSDEKATKVDLNMMPTIGDISYVPWFDAAGIANAVHEYQNGAKEMKYTDKDEMEKMSDLITSIMERLGVAPEEEGGTEEDAQSTEAVQTTEGEQTTESVQTTEEAQASTQQ